jgi:hypothetical protein
MHTSPRLLAIALALASSLCACTSLQSVSVTQIPANRSKPVRAEVDNTALFGIHFDNDFVDDLTAQLMQQCPHGKITGILTKHENTTYVIVQTRRIVASGWCVYEEGAPAQPHDATAMNEAQR